MTGDVDLEGLISRDLSYLMEKYVPMTIKDTKQWLD